jgi:hypothetical protein
MFFLTNALKSKNPSQKAGVDAAKKAIPKNMVQYTTGF